MQCHDCNGSGKYIGLFQIENCKTCMGTGSARLPGDGAYLAEKLSVDPYIFGIPDAQAKRTPRFARFDFDKLSSIPRFDRPAVYWIYVGRTPLDSENWIAWNKKTVSHKKALDNFRGNSSYYALYQRIKVPVTASVYDAVYQLAEAK